MHNRIVNSSTQKCYLRVCLFVCLVFVLLCLFPLYGCFCLFLFCWGGVVSFFNIKNYYFQSQNEPVREEYCKGYICSSGTTCYLSTPCPAHYTRNCIGKFSSLCLYRTRIMSSQATVQ